MWLSDKSPNRAQLGRRVLLLCATAFAVASCGFEPALAPGGSLDKLWGKIDFAAPASRNDFILKDELETRLGSGNAFEFVYVIKTSVSGIGISPDQVTTRQQINGSVKFSLRDTATDADLLSDQVDGFTSYGTTGTTASTTFAQEAAYDRLMVILADKIVSRLAAQNGLPS